MNTQTSLVAEQIRLQQWADQIRDCQNRPSDMKVDAWCREHGITKANYYYRLRRVREACLKICDPSPSFVELTAPAESIPAKASHTHSSVAAVLHAESGITIDMELSSSSMRQRPSVTWMPRNRNNWRFPLPAR